MADTEKRKAIEEGIENQGFSIEANSPKAHEIYIKDTRHKPLDIYTYIQIITNPKAGPEVALASKDILSQPLRLLTAQQEEAILSENFQQQLNRTLEIQKLLNDLAERRNRQMEEDDRQKALELFIQTSLEELKKLRSQDLDRKPDDPLVKLLEEIFKLTQERDKWLAVIEPYNQAWRAEQANQNQAIVSQLENQLVDIKGQPVIFTEAVRAQVNQALDLRLTPLDILKINPGGIVNHIEEIQGAVEKKKAQGQVANQMVHNRTVVQIFNVNSISALSQKPDGERPTGSELLAIMRKNRQTGYCKVGKNGVEAGKSFLDSLYPKEMADGISKIFTTGRDKMVALATDFMENASALLAADKNVNALNKLISSHQIKLQQLEQPNPETNPILKGPG